MSWDEKTPMVLERSLKLGRKSPSAPQLGSRRRTLGRSGTEFVAEVNAVCRHCKRDLRGQRDTLTLDLRYSNQLTCENCQAPFLLLNERQRRGSLYSILARFSMRRTSSPMVRASSRNEDASISPLSPQHQDLASRLDRDQSPEGGPSRPGSRGDKHLPSALTAQSRMQSHSGDAEQHAGVEAASAKIPSPQNRRTTPKPVRTKLRCKILRAAVKPLNHLIGKDVMIDVTQKSLNPSSSANGVHASSVQNPSEEPHSQPGKTDVADIPPGQETLSESPTAKESSFDIGREARQAPANEISNEDGNVAELMTEEPQEELGIGETPHIGLHVHTDNLNGSSTGQEPHEDSSATVTPGDTTLPQPFSALVTGEKSNFQFILRLLNTNVDGKQKVMYALTKIKGVGRRYSNLVCKKADVDLTKRAGELTSEELERIVTIIQNPLQYKIPAWFLNRQRDIVDGKDQQVLANGVDSKLREDLERLKKIRAHRGLRHYWGLRVRGQHSKTTGRRGRTVGVSKKKG
ncbi:MAG: hypothetical protein Q9159_007036 [Coniocarpon cinnabarinum]